MQNAIKYDSELILNKLIEVIKDSKLSFGEIARRTGIPKSSIHRYANGQTKKIPIEAVRLIADATGVTTGYIMGWKEESQLTNNALSKDSALSKSQKELIELFDSAPPELQAAALAVLKSAEKD